MGGKSIRYGWFIWALGASFFFSEYFARVSPSVMIEQLMSQYHITAIGVGSMSAIFLHAYIAVQLPVGLFIDQYGPRRLLSVMAGICSIGCVVFAYADSLFAGQLARFMMGLGGGFAFVGTLKIAMLWLPRNRFAFLTGLTQAIGMFGAAFGEGPMRLIVSHMGWRNTMLSIALVLALIGIMIGVFVKERQVHDPSMEDLGRESKKIWHALLEVMRNKSSWVNAAFIALLYGPTGTFGELWGASYLHHTHLVSEQFAASSISMMFIGLGIGGPITGWLSDHLGTRVIIMRWSAALSFLLLLILLYAPLPGFSLPILCFCYGFANTGLGVTYAHAGELNRVLVGGTAMAFANMASVALASVFQPLLGWLMDLHWHGEASEVVRVYAASDYQFAVFILPLTLLIAFCVSFFLRDNKA